MGKISSCEELHTPLLKVKSLSTDKSSALPLYNEETGQTFLALRELKGAQFSLSLEASKLIAYHRLGFKG